MQPAIPIIFVLLGFLGYLVPMPRKEQHRVCFIFSCYHGMGYMSIILWVVGWMCSAFCLFIALSSVLYEVNLQIIPLPEYLQGDKLYITVLQISLAGGFLIMICTSFFGQLFWSTTVNALVIAFVAKYLFDLALGACGSQACYGLRVLLAVAISYSVSAIFSVYVLRWPSDIATHCHYYLCVSFTIVMSIVILDRGFERWVDENDSAWWLFLVTLAVAIARWIIDCMIEYLYCCREKFGYRTKSSYARNYLQPRSQAPSEEQQQVEMASLTEQSTAASLARDPERDDVEDWVPLDEGEEEKD